MYEPRSDDDGNRQFFVATAGVGLATLLAASLGSIVRLPRAAIAVTMAAGIALIGLAAASLISA